MLKILPSLNRTFYGIETATRRQINSAAICLNRTFYGIETRTTKEHVLAILGLNRTFYGIETVDIGRYRIVVEVLIVPFMELKLK